MTKLSQMKQSSTHRVCIYGSPKSGKTQLIGALAEHFTLLWFDLENGHNTLFKLSPEMQERIEIIEIPDTKNFPIAIETMLKVITGARVSLCLAHGKVSCALCSRNIGADGFQSVELASIPNDVIVVVESLTQLANSAMAHITKDKDDTYKAEWADFRVQGQLMDRFLSQVQQAKFNIICSTHEAEVELEDSKKKLVPVSGTTNFSRNTAKYFDHIVYCDLSNRTHKFASSSTYSSAVLTGSRTDVALEAYEIPSLLAIFAPQSAPSLRRKQENIQENTQTGSSLLERLKQLKREAQT